MAKKTVVQKSAGATTIDVNSRVVIAFDADEVRIQETIRALVEAKQISQSAIAEILKIPASHVSRWLTGKPGKQGYQLPFWVLVGLSKLLERRLLVALIDIQPEGKIRRPPSARLVLQQFFIGMASINPQEGPLAVARHIATVWNAKSWSLYRENPRRNILDWCGDATTIRFQELMQGPSWISELPTRVARLYEQEQLSLRERDSTVERFFEFEWSQERSAFARREKIGFCVGIPFRAHEQRTAVLFLNFEKRPESFDLMREPLLIAIHQLQGAIQQNWPVRRTVGTTMQRGASSFREILALMQTTFSNFGRLDEAVDARIDDGISKSLIKVCDGLWPGQDKSCNVFALQHVLECFTKEPTELRFSGNQEPDPDRMIRRSAAYGETYYVEDLSRNPIRNEFDPENRIPASQLQRIVVPIRCEATGVPHEPRETIVRSEFPNHKVFRYPLPDRSSVLTWGALSVDSDERFFSRDKAIELNMVTHLLACALYLPKLVKAANGRARAKQISHGVFKSVCDAVLEVVNHLSDSEHVRRELTAEGMPPDTEDRTPGALQPFCEAVITKELIAGAERCDVYLYDHVRREFHKGGSYLSSDWVSQIQQTHPELLDDCGSVEHLGPRPGGNSERLLGLVDEYHFILNARRHPRVSPITKIIGTEALIGCSYRVGSSLEADGVLWLGFRKESGEYFSYRNIQEMLPRLRVITHIAAMFCAMLRWWGSWPVSPSDEPPAA
ncbi:MAG: helix-turn-helix domain-containing protein [Pirellulaceae bacterium]